MSPKTCPVDGCDEFVRVKDAPAMPTLVSPDGSMRTEFDVAYCDNGHIVNYRDRQVPVGGETDQPARPGGQESYKPLSDQ